MSELYPEWVSYYDAVASYVGDGITDRVLELRGIVPPYCDDPEKDEKVEQMRRLYSLVPEVQDYVHEVIVDHDARHLLPSPYDLPSGTPVSAISEHIRPRKHIRRGLIVYGLAFGLDMLEDAVNSGVPLEDIVV